MSGHLPDPGTQGETTSPYGGPATTVTESRNEAFTVPGLDPDKMSPIVEALQRRLVGLIDMSLTLKHIHWNVVGPSFIGVHETLGQLGTAEAGRDAADGAR